MSHLEESLAFQLRAAGIEFEREAQVIPGRKFRYDFSLGKGLLVEVQGGSFARGKMGHTSGTGIHRDCEKAVLAALAGYRLLPLAEKHITSGQGLLWIQEALV